MGGRWVGCASGRGRLGGRGIRGRGWRGSCGLGLGGGNAGREPGWDVRRRWVEEKVGRLTRCAFSSVVEEVWVVLESSPA